MVTPSCPVHGSRCVMRMNPLGGFLWGCASFASHGCRITFSSDGTKMWGAEHVVAPSSSRRGRVTSIRALVRLKLVAQGLSADEVEEFLSLGLDEVQRLVG